MRKFWKRTRIIASETPDAAQRIMRTQLAGVQGQVSTIITRLGQLGAQLDRIEGTAGAAHAAGRRAAWAVSHDARENGEYARQLQAGAVADDGGPA